MRQPRRRFYRVLIGSLLGICLSGGWVLFLALPSTAVSVASVPNPQAANGSWVSDTANMISPESESQLNQLVSQLEATTGAELAIVTVPDTRPAASPKQFATELFNTWGIGKAGEDNGVLFLVSKGDRRTEVETGYGIEGLLPDAKVGKILDAKVTPQFKSGNFDGGILAGTTAIITAITGEEVSLPAPSLVGQATPQETLPIQPVIAQPVPVSPESTSLLSRRSLADESTEFRVFLGVLFAGLLTVLVLSVVVLKPLRTGQVKPIYIKPVDHSRIAKIGNLSFYLWARAWIGDKKSDRFINGGGFLSIFDGSQYGQTNQRLASESSWLIVHARNRQFTLVCAVLLGLGVVVSIALTGVGVGAIALSPIVTGAWLATEIWISNHQARVKDPLLQAIKRWLFISFLAIFPLLPIAFFTGGLGLLASPFFLILFYGTSAGLLRLFRASEKGYDVLCKSCDRPMQLLTTTQLTQHLSKPKQTEIRIGTKAYEGWCCQTCSLLPQTNTFSAKVTTPNLHLFSFGLKKSGYKTCKTCQALTLKVTSRVIKSATTYSSGSRRITKECACCHARSEKTVRIPKKSTSNSSSSGSSYSSGSSSSGGSSGSSFGGGSSGGGGAGSSW
ncbi:MAG: TPM domain-containing protein [Cyanobacteria bacterium P01_A01_bin.116]